MTCKTSRYSVSDEGEMEVEKERFIKLKKYHLDPKVSMIVNPSKNSLP